MTVIGWREQIANNPGLADVTSWPHPRVDELPEPVRTRYCYYLEAIKAVVSGTPVDTVSSHYKIKKSLIYYLLNRSLSSKGGEPPALSRAFIKGNRLGEYRRTATLTGKDSGFAGAMQMLERKHVSTFDRFRQLIREDARRSKHAECLTPKSFFAIFQRLLAAVGVTSSDYPFNTESKGKESSRKFFHAVREEYFSERIRFPGEVKSEIQSKMKLLQLFEEIQFDEHIQDTELSIDIEFEDGTKKTVRIPRFWLMVMIERRTESVIAYCFGYGKQISQDDVLELLASANSIWQPFTELPAGLEYFKGAGLPSGVIPQARFATARVYRGDNSWSHHATSVKNFVLNNWKAVLNLGRAKYPIARQLVEAFFKIVAQYEHQNPSTTGSYPTDPIKETKAHRKYPPLNTIEKHQKAIDVIVANYNATPRAHLLNTSPLGEMQELFDQGAIVKHVEPCFRGAENPFEFRVLATMRGNPELHVRPHVHFLYAKYKFDDAPKIKSKRGDAVVLIGSRRDVRRLRVELPDGRLVGEAVVEGRWRYFAHGVLLRKQVHKFDREHTHAYSNPVGSYFQSLIGDLTPRNTLKLFSFVGSREYSLTSQRTPEEKSQIAIRPEKYEEWVPRCNRQ